MHTLDRAKERGVKPIATTEKMPPKVQKVTHSDRQAEAAAEAFSRERRPCCIWATVGVTIFYSALGVLLALPATRSRFLWWILWASWPLASYWAAAIMFRGIRRWQFRQFVWAVLGPLALLVSLGVAAMVGEPIFDYFRWYRQSSDRQDS